MGDEIEWRQNSQPAGLGPHADYAVNLQDAEKFCAKIQGSLFEGMKVCIADSQGVKSNLLTISYQPDIGKKGPIYVCPININQDNKRFNYEVDYLFNRMYRKIYDNNKKKQTVMDFG